LQYSVSDLKEPLQLTDLLKNGIMELKKSEYLLKSQLASQNLMEVLINDLMDHAKLENEQFAFS